MTSLTIQKAVRHQERARVALIGPSGSGKTMTALLLAQGLCNGGRIGLVDSEHGSASKYAGTFDFDTLRLPSFEPAVYVEAIQLFAQTGEHDVLIIDSLSHAWTQGALKMVDQIAKRNRNDSFSAWRDVTPEHYALVDAILSSPLHVVATMRSKTEYVREEENGRTKIRKVGLAPVQRDGMEYEFDVVADIDTDHTMIVSKSRVPILADKIIKKPGVKVGEALRGWLSEGEPNPVRVPEQPVEPPLPAPVEDDEPLDDAIRRQLKSGLNETHATRIREDYGSTVKTATAALIERHGEDARNLALLLDTLIANEEGEHVDEGDVEIVGGAS